MAIRRGMFGQRGGASGRGRSAAGTEYDPGQVAELLQAAREYLGEDTTIGDITGIFMRLLERQGAGYGGDETGGERGSYSRNAGAYGAQARYGHDSGADGDVMYRGENIPESGGADGSYSITMLGGANGGASADRSGFQRRALRGLFRDGELLGKYIPGFDFRGAMQNSAFRETLKRTLSVMEAYEAMTRLPKNAPRETIAQNGQTARRGTGESSVNPARLESEEFMRYIEKIKNG